MIVRRSRKRGPVGEFGQLVRGHRERLGITITDLARYASIDQGLLSKIERGIRPPPQLVPYVERFASRFQLDHSSGEYRQLMAAAYRERFGEAPIKGGHRSLLVTMGPASSRGLSGLPLDLTPPESAAGRYYASLGQKVGEGLKNSEENVSGAEQPGVPLKAQTLPVAQPPVRHAVPNATDIGQLLSMLTGYGIQVTRFEQRDNRRRAEFLTPEGEEWVVTAERKKRKSKKRERG